MTFQMTTKKSNVENLQHDQGKLNRLTQICLENLKTVYEWFGCEFYEGEKTCFSKCFIHGGDNENALNLYHKADYRVHFKCRTHLCENHFGSSLLSMIRGGLSHAKYGWEFSGDKEASFDETIQFILESLELSYDEIETKNIINIRPASIPLISVLENIRPKGLYKREDYVSSVCIPSKYYIERGYSEEILKKYEVGVCSRPGRQMSNRSVAPIYDDDGEKIVGFTGRSVFDQCEECNSYHRPGSCFNFPKWRHSKGFRKEKTLYNFWKAKYSILKSCIAIIVESPGNVWRLEEAGIHNSVALFGTALNYPQRQMLDESGALSLIIIMDNDENNAGEIAAQKISDQCKKAYNTFVLKVPKQDIGCMTVEEVKDNILPFIKTVEEKICL